MAFYRNRPRRATLAEWTSVNPTLMLGEMAIITPDTGTGTGKVKVKFGDGVSFFNSLPYAYNEEEIDIDALISDFTESSTETDAVSGDTYGVIIGKFVKSIKTFRTNISNIVGNIGTIANLLTTDKSSLVNAVNELKNGKIEKANIVNNTVTTVSGTVLDGRMGKILQDQITEQNNNLANKIKSYSLIRTPSPSWVFGLGSTDLILYIDVSDLGLANKPLVATFIAESFRGYQYQYNYDASTSTTLVIRIITLDAGEVVDGVPLRFGLVLTY